jgi:hypothetical protein
VVKIENNKVLNKSVDFVMDDAEDQLRHVTQTCKVCASAKSKYTCPRCNAPYCSVKCYKNHGLTCSESFYRSQVEDSLKVAKVSEKDKEEVLRALKETYEDERFVPSENMWRELELLERLSLKDELRLEDLNKDQRRRFMNAVRGGHLSAHINIWTPWWNQTPEEHRKRFGILDLENDDRNSSMRFCVSHNKSMTTPKIKRVPDSRLRFHLIDILYAYVHVMRMYNGKHDTDCIDASSTLYNASLVLSNPKEAMHLSSTSHVLRTSIERLRLRFGSVHKADSRFEALASDVLSLLKCRHFILDALHDCFIILKQALQESRFAGDGKQREKSISIRASWKRASKKILFFLSWITVLPTSSTTMKEEEDTTMTMSEDMRVSLYKDLALTIQLMQIERDSAT